MIVNLLEVIIKDDQLAPGILDSAGPILGEYKLPDRVILYLLEGEATKGWEKGRPGFIHAINKRQVLEDRVSDWVSRSINLHKNIGEAMGKVLKQIEKLTEE